MVLLYAALAYLGGLLLAACWWQLAAPACSLPASLWLLPAALLPLTPWLDRAQRPKPLPPMRWPSEAGFERPDEGLKPSLIGALALCLLAGVLRYGGEPFTRCWSPADLAYYNLPATQTFDRSAPPVTVTGKVDSYPLLVDGRQELIVAAESLEGAGAGGEAAGAVAVQGRVRVTTGGEPRLRYGQQVAVSGRLSEPAIFDDFSYKDYLAIQRVNSVLYAGQVQALAAPEGGSLLLRSLYSLRSRGEALIDRSLPEPYAALANGMLLGIEAGIPDALYDQFNATGTSHVIVISGTNVSQKW